MVDEEQPPAKKVVKRVVKKTVTRPAAPAPTVRYGRPVQPGATKPQAKVASRPGGSSPTGTTKTRPPRPRVEVGAKVGRAGRALTSRGSSVTSGLAGRVGSAGRSTGSFATDRFRALVAWRIPHIDLRIASVVTGVLVGLASVGLGVAALAIFSDVRGVSSGGGRWGSLTFVLVAFVAFILGDLLLSAFGSTRPGLTSFLGVVLTIVAILGVFLDLADSQWALVLIPALGALAFLVANGLLALADNNPGLPE
jgi:hypothetical protein